MKQSQHYISQKHLSYWSHDGKSVWRFDKLDHEIKSLPIKVVATRNNQWAKEVENPIFSNFETRHPQIISILEVRGEITPEIEKYLHDWKSLLFSRAPKQKKNMDRLTNELFAAFGYSTPGVNHYTEAMLTEMALHNQFERQQTYVSIMVAPQGSTFLITDNPASFGLPLTPKMMFFPPSKNIKNKRRYIDSDDIFVQQANNEMIKRAERFIFSSEKNHPDLK